MLALIFILLYGFLAIIYSKLFRNYNLGISVAKKNFAGLLIFREVFALIGVSSIFLNSFPIYFFNGFSNTSQDSVFFISLIIWLTLFFYIISLYIGTNLTYKWFNKKNGNGKDLKNILFVSVLFSFSLYMVLFNFYGVKHAFFDALFRGGDLLSIRLDNKYATDAPSFLFSILNISTFFSLILFALSNIKIKVLNFFYIFILFMLLTYSGGKAPLIYGLVVYGLVKLTTLKDIKLNMVLLVRSFFTFIVFLGLLFFVVKVQFPEFNKEDFLIYFINRLGVGQIAGTYEQFNLKLYDSKYIYHSIPFASLFFEYPVFQKDLMIISESVYDPSSTGIKNSLFISEASSFGVLFLVISPFIVGFNTAISIALIAIFLSKMYINDRLFSFKISTFMFLSVNTITGGFSDYMFFKSLVLIIISLTVIIFMTKILDLIFKK